MEKRGEQKRERERERRRERGEGETGGRGREKVKESYTCSKTTRHGWCRTLERFHNVAFIHLVEGRKEKLPVRGKYRE